MIFSSSESKSYNITFGHESENVDTLLLADSVGPVHGLQIVHGVEVVVEHDHDVRAREVEPKSPDPSGQDDHLVRVVHAESLHKLGPFFDAQLVGQVNDSYKGKGRREVVDDHSAAVPESGENDDFIWVVLTGEDVFLLVVQGVQDASKAPELAPQVEREHFFSFGNRLSQLFDEVSVHRIGAHEKGVVY